MTQQRMGRSTPHTGSRKCRGPRGGVRVGSGWGDRTEGTRPDPWAVFTPTPVKSLQALPYLMLMVFGPIMQLRRLRLRDCG